MVWILAVICVALLLVIAGMLANLQRERKQLLQLRSQLNSDAQKLTAVEKSRAESQQQVSSLRGRVAELEKEMAMATQMARGLEEQMRAELESKDVTISKLQGKLTVNILDRILFDSGEAVLKSDGEAVLRKIASILAQHGELKVHVIGHTDNVPMRPSPQNRYASNWELSTARALAAVRFLTEQAGVSPQRLGAVGYGEFRPLADNGTVEGRARNRRIAVTILADELAGVDLTPEAAATNTALPKIEAPLVKPSN
jgi:chemotaxis protein MotB